MSRELTVVTYNVKGGREAAALAAELAPIGADVICLNEAPRRRARALARRLGMAAATGGILRQRSINAILTRDRPRSARTIPLPGDPSREARTAIVVELGVTVVCAHLALDAADRARCADVLLGLASGPALVCGDLNEDTDGVAYRTMTGRLVDLCGGLGPTFPAHAPRARIDHVLASPGIEAISCRVLEPGASDHLGVVAVLRVP